MKRKLFSLLVLLTAAVTGAWADVVYERTLTSWASTDVNNGAGSWIANAASANAEQGLYVSGSGNRAATLTFTHTDQTIQTIDLVFNNAYNTGDNGNYSYVDIGNAIRIRSNQQAQNGYVIINGEETAISHCNVKNINRGGDLWTIHVEINTATNTLTALTLSGNVGGANAASFTLAEATSLGSSATYSTVTLGTNRAKGTPAAGIQSIKIAEEIPAVGDAFDLKVGINDHSTMKFYVGQEEVTSAHEGQTVKVVVTPDENWSIGNVTGQWIAAMAKAPRRTAGIGLLQDVDVTFVSEDAQTGAHTYTFVMQRAKAEFSVVYKKHLDHPDITISNILPVIYNAQAHTPSFTVKDGSKVLVLGTDYTVTYSDNVMACDKDAAENAPTVTIKAVEGHNFYVGENSKTFTIRKKTLEDGFMSKVADLTYNGKAQEPAPTLTYDGITLVAGTDYVFSYINNKDVASTTDAKAPVVTASAVKNSNFTGAATQKFNIKKAPLTIKAADVNIIHGSEVPQYEVSYEGFVADETVAVLEGTLAVACGYTKESAVGSTYDITPSGFTSKNYDITFVPGKLTVLVNQAAVDQAAADDVMGKISAIGEVAYNETSKGLIDAAREAYNALTDAQKALVTNLETLTNAETTYANLKAAAEKAAADQLAADDVIAKITAIGEVAYNETSKGLIDAARNAYTALTEDQRALVNNYEVLTTAETTYANLKAAAEKAAADQLAAGEVIDKIIAIGEVAYTPESKALIDAARNAYSELTEDQKALVTNYEVLTVAETTYANLKAAAQQAADDQEAANEVIGKINAIGEVAYTTECKNLIDAARNAYSELTADQKALVTNYEVLTTAETTYANLKAAAEKAAADKAAADDVIAKINAIGEVAYTEACKNLIDAARNAYNALTADQKALVTNYEVLTTAETTYANLKAAAEKAAADKAAADDVIAKINAIGEVAYTEACKNLIATARNAYTALTEDQKALVTNLSVLTDAETTYAELAQIATGISTIKAIAGKTIYDMNGRKVTVPSKKGIYIINGKKVVVK